MGSYHIVKSNKVSLETFMFQTNITPGHGYAVPVIGATLYVNGLKTKLYEIIKEKERIIFKVGTNLYTTQEIKAALSKANRVWKTKK